MSYGDSKLLDLCKLILSLRKGVIVFLFLKKNLEYVFYHFFNLFIFESWVYALLFCSIYWVLCSQIHSMTKVVNVVLGTAMFSGYEYSSQLLK
jgi:hypothetical protein